MEKYLKREQISSQTQRRRILPGREGTAQVFPQQPQKEALRERAPCNPWRAHANHERSPLEIIRQRNSQKKSKECLAQVLFPKVISKSQPNIF